SRELMEALVRQGLWPVEQALAYARRTTPTLKAAALTRLAPLVESGERWWVLAEALQAARAIGYEDDRAEALSGLAPHLPEDQRGPALTQALQAARAIGDEGDPARPRAGLAPNPPGDLLGQATKDARRLGE